MSLLINVKRRFHIFKSLCLIFYNFLFVQMKSYQAFLKYKILLKSQVTLLIISLIKLFLFHFSSLRTFNKVFCLILFRKLFSKFLNDLDYFKTVINYYKMALLLLNQFKIIYKNNLKLVFYNALIDLTKTILNELQPKDFLTTDR